MSGQRSGGPWSLTPGLSGSGGLVVVRRALARQQADDGGRPARQRRCVVAVTAVAANHDRFAGEVIEQVLADEVLRVDVGEIELAELRAEVLLQLRLSALAHLPQFSQRA